MHSIIRKMEAHLVGRIPIFTMELFVENSKVAAAYGIVTNQCFTSYSPQNLSRTVMVTCDESKSPHIIVSCKFCSYLFKI